MIVGEHDPYFEKLDMVKLQAVMDVIRDTHAGSFQVIQ